MLLLQGLCLLFLLHLSCWSCFTRLFGYSFCRLFYSLKLQFVQALVSWLCGTSHELISIIKSIYFLWLVVGVTHSFSFLHQIFQQTHLNSIPSWFSPLVWIISKWWIWLRSTGSKELNSTIYMIFVRSLKNSVRKTILSDYFQFRNSELKHSYTL